MPDREAPSLGLLQQNSSEVPGTQEGLSQVTLPATEKVFPKRNPEMGP